MKISNILYILTICIACSCVALGYRNYENEKHEIVSVQEPTQKLKDPICQETIFEPKEIKSSTTKAREEKINEVVMLWKLFFEDEKVHRKDLRRKRFQEFAEYVVDAVEMYQNNPTDIGGQLPKDKNAHLIIATMITKESSITYNVVGKIKKLREVGLLQVHGKALSGYRRKTVKNNPKLGVLLGVRWLAAQVPQCKQSLSSWSIDDWAYPVSLYGGGAQRAIKNGKCIRFKSAKDRIRLTKLYRSRIDALKVTR